MRVVLVVVGLALGGLAALAALRLAPSSSPSGAPSIAPNTTPHAGSARPGIVLPVGCSRVTEGTDASLSHDGRLLAFARWRTWDGKVLSEEEKESLYRMSSFSMAVRRLWVRDLVAGTEWEVPEPAPSEPDGAAHGSDRVVIGWAPGEALVLEDGIAIDPRTGKPVESVLRPPADAHIEQFPRGEAPRTWAWTADGRRLAYLAEAGPVPAGKTAQRALFVVDAGGAARRVDLGPLRDGRPHPWEAYPEHLSGATLAWAPGGETLLFRLGYLRVLSGGPDRMERVGLFFVRDTRVLLLEESPALDMAPDERTGEDVWDAAGRRCAFLVASAARPPVLGKPWEGTTDLEVAGDAGRDLRRVTSDGIEKGRPCIDPAGQRVALFVGEGSGSRGAVSPGIRLRVVDIESGRAWGSPLAPPPNTRAWLGTLRWMPGGRRLLYAYDGADGAIYLQDVPLGER